MIEDPLERARAALLRARRTTAWERSSSNAASAALLLADIEQAERLVGQQLLADPMAPDAAALGDLIAELAEIAAELNRTVGAEGWTRVVNVHDVASRLRTAASQTELLELAATELHALGFERVLMSQVDGDRWIPLVVNRGSSSEMVPNTACQLDETRLTRSLHEFELVHTRQALLVTDAERDDHVHRGFQHTTRTRSYVAAPVLASGVVAGMVHADHLPDRSVTEHDAAVLGVFAACLGYAIERLSLVSRLHAVLQEATVTPGALLTSTDDLLAARPRSAPAANRPDRRLEQHRATLTAREQEVLGLLAKGMSNNDIAAELVVSESTVKAHVKNILRKLGATNRAEAVARFFRGN